MNITQYENILNNVIRMAPLESGVQTLAYMFLYEMFENVEDNIIVIDKLQKKSRFNSLSGISDLAIVTKDFDYHDINKGEIKFCIEIKASYKKLSGYEYKLQILGQLLTYKKALATNGDKWVYYDIDNYLGKLDGFQETLKHGDLKNIIKLIEEGNKEKIRDFLWKYNWIDDLLNSPTWQHSLCQWIDKDDKTKVGIIKKSEYLGLVKDLYGMLEVL